MNWRNIPICVSFSTIWAYGAQILGFPVWVLLLGSVFVGVFLGYRFPPLKMAQDPSTRALDSGGGPQMAGKSGFRSPGSTRRACSTQNKSRD